MALKTEQKTRVVRKTRLSRSSELDDAVTWLSEHIGFPAPSREDLERRRRERRTRAA